MHWSVWTYPLLLPLSTHLKGKRKHRRWVQDILTSKSSEGFLVAFRASAKNSWPAVHFPVFSSTVVKDFLQHCISFSLVFHLLLNASYQPEPNQERAAYWWYDNDKCQHVSANQVTDCSFQYNQSTHKTYKHILSWNPPPPTVSKPEMQLRIVVIFKCKKKLQSSPVFPTLQPRLPLSLPDHQCISARSFLLWLCSGSENHLLM